MVMPFSGDVPAPWAVSRVYEDIYIYICVCMYACVCVCVCVDSLMGFLNILVKNNYSGKIW
jgi:hypothetical protein